jgi:hypothetical protein
MKRKRKPWVTLEFVALQRTNPFVFPEYASSFNTPDDYDASPLFRPSWLVSACPEPITNL